MRKIGVFDLNRVYCLDARVGVGMLPDESVQCCVTSPPYWGLRDYGLEPSLWDDDPACEHEWGDSLLRNVSAISDKTGLHNDGRKNPITEKYRDTLDNMAPPISQGQFCQHCGAWLGSLGLEPTPELYIAHIVQVFGEVRRVLRRDGTLWLNIGDSYWGGKGANGSSKARRTASKRGYVQSGGTVMMNTRPSDGKHETLKPKDLCMIPARVALALQADGWYLRCDIIWHKPNPMPESVRDRPTKSHEYVFLLSKSKKYFYDQDAIREPFAYPDKKFNRKTKQHKTHGLSDSRTTSGLHDGKREQYGDPEKGKNRRSVWEIPTEPNRDAHFAAFPTELARRCILAGTSEKGQCSLCGSPYVRIVEKTRSFESGSGRSGNPITGKQDSVQGGGETLDIRRGPCVHTTTLGWEPSCSCRADTASQIVLDPFAGSGRAGQVAIEEGRSFIGFDLNESYCSDIAQPKLEKAMESVNA